MKKINDSLFGLFLLFWQLATPASNSEQLQTNLTHLSQVKIEQTTEPEFKKWEYLEKQFEPDINNISLSQKVGHHLKKYSAAITISSGFFYTMLMLYIYEHHLKGQLHRVEVNIKEHYVRKGWATYFPESSPELLAYFGVAFMITDLLMLTYLSLKAVGITLENRENLCYQKLINFVKIWDKNKPKTPIILHPLFEQLSMDLEKNGNFTKIDPNIAKNIVDAIVATALFVNSSLCVNR